MLYLDPTQMAAGPDDEVGLQVTCTLSHTSGYGEKFSVTLVPRVDIPGYSLPLLSAEPEPRNIS